ncbi:MAG: hypothetical protein M9924_05790 [Rhizobiaceae bacterium]|nr:hypothetical protein [Rhizobiaceae bacterium]
MKPAAGKFDQILLKRLDPHDIAYLELVESTVWPIGFNDVSVAIAEEPRDDTLMFETDIVEIAEYIFRRRLAQCPSVMRARPSVHLRLMAGSALLGPDIVWRVHGACACRQTEHRKKENRQEIVHRADLAGPLSSKRLHVLSPWLNGEVAKLGVTAVLRVDP